MEMLAIFILTAIFLLTDGTLYLLDGYVFIWRSLFTILFLGNKQSWIWFGTYDGYSKLLDEERKNLEAKR